jgi:FkbM family methyltransferase
MPGSIRQRAACVWGLRGLDRQIRPTFFEAILRSCEWYGIRRRNVRKHLIVGPAIDRHRVVLWQDFKIVIPEEFPIERLVSIVIELAVPTNPHYFFHHHFKIENKGLIVDVGACEGLFSLLAAKRWPECKILAIEPAPGMCAALARTVELNNYPNRIAIDNCLLGESNGIYGFIENISDPATSHLVKPGDIQVPSEAAQTVRMYKLDDLPSVVNEKIALIKMDAEGAELDIIKGARGVIVRDRPALCITTYHRQHDALDIHSLLSELDLDYIITVRGITCMNEMLPRPVMLFAIPK